MANNYGKKFEAKFKEDFSKLQDVSIDRIYDVTSGYAHISNVCDFICYHYPNIFYIECKSHEGNTFPFSKLTQYDKLKDKVRIKGVRTGVVLWMIDHSIVVYLPISTVTQMMSDGKKSFNIKMLQDKTYNIIEIPSEKKRVFLDSDYSVLLNLDEGM